MAGLANINADDSPPIAHEVLEGAPSTTWQDFKRARLRQFKLGSQISWLGCLGYGREGIVFKAVIDGGDPVAVKVFWITQRPKPRMLPNGNGFCALEWPLEDESRTVALLEKIKWAMTEADEKTDRPVTFMRRPKTAAHAIAKLRAFSDEARRSPNSAATPRDPVKLPPFPPLPKCYGWTKISRDVLCQLNPPAWEAVDEHVDWHWAIVYEFVPEQPHDTAVGQSHLDFFYAVGFAMEAYKPDNWRGGRLVDLNDVCSPFSIGWGRTSVFPRDARTWFWDVKGC